MSESIDKKLKAKLKRLEDFEKKATGHRARVKERFFREGPEAFTDEDLLELLLFFGIPRKDTRKIARELLACFKNDLSNVLDAEPTELLKISGLGPSAILPLKVAREVARRYLRTRAKKAVYLRSPKEVYDYLWFELKARKRETFVVVYLSALSEVLHVDELFEGTITEAVVYPREVFSQAIKLSASSIIVAHNHPSGSLKPSQEDIRLTELLYLAGKLLHIKLVDHLIIGDFGYFSFAEEGLLEEIARRVSQRL
ncbi:MAG: DNA repair protein RadC [Thermodesulfobacterium sp.]|jgi:DNA repair protein RadC|nr:DNA repair protein RadC [Thermodesulfobacterium sp.]